MAGMQAKAESKGRSEPPGIKIHSGMASPPSKKDRILVPWLRRMRASGSRYSMASSPTKAEMIK
jgi:hypothetical protein